MVHQQAHVPAGIAGGAIGPGADSDWAAVRSVVEARAWWWPARHFSQPAAAAVEAQADAALTDQPSDGSDLHVGGSANADCGGRRPAAAAHAAVPAAATIYARQAVTAAFVAGPHCAFVSGFLGFAARQPQLSLLAAEVQSAADLAARLCLPGQQPAAGPAALPAEGAAASAEAGSASVVQSPETPAELRRRRQ